MEKMPKWHGKHFGAKARMASFLFLSVGQNSIRHQCFGVQTKTASLYTVAKC